MELTVSERLIVLYALGNSKGTLTTLRVVREVQNLVGFSAEELKVLEFSYPDGKTVWKDTVAPHTFDIPDAGRDIIIAWFAAQDKAETLTLELLPIYEKFLLTIAPEEA